MKIVGKVIKYGDDINTDLIIAGKYTKTLCIQDLASHVFEDLDPDFIKKMDYGSILVAGNNFGCGSSREQAPIAIKTVGIKAIVAKSFSRIFYRNAINIGLLLIECNTNSIEDMHKLEYVLGSTNIKDLDNGLVISVKPLPKIMGKIITEGGVVSYIKKYKEL